MNKLSRLVRALVDMALSLGSVYMALLGLGGFLTGNPVMGLLFMTVAFLLDLKLEVSKIRRKLGTKNESSSNSKNSCCGPRPPAGTAGV